MNDNQTPDIIEGHALATLEPVRVEGVALPPILAGQTTPAIVKKVEKFYLSVAEIFEAWVTRRKSPHTQRAYRCDVMSLVQFLGIRWPEESHRMFTVSVTDVLAWRDEMLADDKAPKTLNRRVSSASSFYKYLQGVAGELRLPITVPNPAHAQFIARDSTDAVDETIALSATKARQLCGLPQGESPIAYRNRAILKFYLYSGARVSTGCRLNVSDFRQDGEEYTIRINEKGSKRRTIGLHFAAGEAINQYLEACGITRGAIFRPRKGSRTEDLANRQMTPTNMYLLILEYLEKLPAAMQEVEAEEEEENGEVQRKCIFSPHSLRATTATLLLDSGVDIKKVQQLLGHKHITTTQIYDKRRIGTSESASHDVPI